MQQTLFLDRDGVINVRPIGDYVRRADDFVLKPGAGEALALLARHFERILVVTNQAGIGKGLMTEDDLNGVHARLRQLTEAAGGRIDGIYHCPHHHEAGCDCRKPAIGMARQAKAEFPDLDFSQSWMVGDSASDMAFGRQMGMKTVLIAGKKEEAEVLAGMAIDHRFGSLLEFAHWYEQLPES